MVVVLSYANPDHMRLRKLSFVRFCLAIPSEWYLLPWADRRTLSSRTLISQKDHSNLVSEAT